MVDAGIELVFAVRPLPDEKKLFGLVNSLVGTAFGCGKYFSILSATGSMRSRGIDCCKRLTGVNGIGCVAGGVAGRGRGS